MESPRVRCPTCQRQVTWQAESEWRPFCSERCRAVDLGAWVTGGRTIPGDSTADAADPDTGKPAAH